MSDENIIEGPNLESIKEPKPKEIEPSPGFHGKCKKCGRCCRNFNLSITYEQLLDYRKQYRKTGKISPRKGKEKSKIFLEETTAEWVGSNVVKNPKYGFRCRLLKGGKCTIHGKKKKPETCKGYGQRYRADPFPGCGYWEGFEKERKEVLKKLKPDQQQRIMKQVRL